MKPVMYNKMELTPCVVHSYPEFERTSALQVTHQYAFRPRDCQEWHRSTVERIIGAIGQGRHFAVYRISHGEFIMALGLRMEAHTLHQWLVRTYVAMRRLLRVDPPFKSGSAENSYEQFSAEELPHARRRYIECLRAISRDGLLAVGLHDTPGFQLYIADYIAWLAANGIIFSEDNYAMFYSIYVLFGGSDAMRLLSGRNILVITSFPGDKRSNLESNLRSYGIKSLQYYEVSPTRAMFDVIDLEKIQRPVDLVLIGAGVGAASVLEQVRPLNAVAIDAGFAIDVLANPELAWNRPLCVPDARLNFARIKFMSPATLAKLAAKR